MELYAAGHNAWRQLDFDVAGSEARSLAEPDDVTSFTPVLSAQTIEHPVSRLSYTLGPLPPSSP